AIMFGTLGTVGSAANQDWSAPGKATLNTALGGGLSALGGYLGGKAAETAGAYLDQWARIKGGNELPEYRPSIANSKGEGYNGNRERAYETVKGLGKSAETSAEGAGNDAYNAYLKMLDELEAARKSGMTAEEATLLDKYNLKMYTEGAGNVGTTRVGRWMSQAEYKKLLETGTVPESFSGTTHVANPADISAFGKQAKPGSVYVEFDVPSTSIKPTSNGWSKIIGPNSLEGRLALKKGLALPEMPKATNIKIVGGK
ncbi:hypothetical protein SAMN02745823_03900, partial [Sporobacter termitidis DSM 10068]